MPLPQHDTHRSNFCDVMLQVLCIVLSLLRSRSRWWVGESFFLVICRSSSIIISSLSNRWFYIDVFCYAFLMLVHSRFCSFSRRIRAANTTHYNFVVSFNVRTVDAWPIDYYYYTMNGRYRKWCVMWWTTTRHSYNSPTLKQHRRHKQSG